MIFCLREGQTTSDQIVNARRKLHRYDGAPPLVIMNAADTFPVKVLALAQQHQQQQTLLRPNPTRKYAKLPSRPDPGRISSVSSCPVVGRALRWAHVRTDRTMTPPHLPLLRPRFPYPCLASYCSSWSLWCRSTLRSVCVYMTGTCEKNVVDDCSGRVTLRINKCCWVLASIFSTYRPCSHQRVGGPSDYPMITTA